MIFFILTGHQDTERIPSKSQDTSKVTFDTRTTEDIPLSSNVIAAGTSKQANTEQNKDMSDRLVEGKQNQEDSEDEYGPRLPPSGDMQPSRTDNTKGGNRHREQRTSKYESYLETYGQSYHRNKHKSRMHERTGERHSSKSRSRSRYDDEYEVKGHRDDEYEVKGQRSQPLGYSDEGDRRSKHSKKESHKGKHGTKDKDSRHKHKHKKDKKVRISCN